MKAFQRELVFTYKFSKWRQYVTKRFFKRIDGNYKDISEVISFADRGYRIKLLTWGVTLEEESLHLDHPNIDVWRLEDGFIRSVGLGIRLTPPISLVADSRGIYYNSQKPSDLECILSSSNFGEDLKQRAGNLIRMLLANRINKYNLAEKEWSPPKTVRKIIVVPGQVETDMSVKYGSPFLKDNINLLAEVRRRNPHDYIVYKPHPDVAGGYRKGYYDKDTLLAFCDEICEGCSSHDLIEHADEIHTISSLFGFEALLRRKRVVCYGHPFYAGWGLTQDIYPSERRRKKLTLEELVAGSLIIYPMYVSLVTGRRISPEEAVYEIISLKRKRPFRWRVWDVIQTLIDPILKFRRF